MEGRAPADWDSSVDDLPLTLTDIAHGLRALRADAGSPSFTEITRRISAARAARRVPAHERTPGRVTVYDCFAPGRKRVDADLVADIVRALGGDEAAAARWTHACRVAQDRADAATVVTVRNTVPTAAGPFVGRTTELDRIIRLLSAGDHRVVLLEGMAGIGKTRLCAHAVRRLRAAGRTTGALYADLRGSHPDQPPADPHAVLEGLLRLVGVPVRQIPTDPDRRRSLLADALRSRPRVVVLDDAAGTDQVRALLPVETDVSVLVTSRVRLRGLGRGVRVPVTELDPDDAVALLRRVGGRQRIDRDPTAARAIARVCGYLPLAVELAANRIARRPEWTLADHLPSLLAPHRRLCLDEAVQVRLAPSYRALSPSARRTLRFMAAQPCPELAVGAVAALTDQSVDDARADLDDLLDHHLVRPQPGRYGLHPFVRAYALNRSYDEDRPVDRASARLRMAEQLVPNAAASLVLSHGDTALFHSGRSRAPRQALAATAGARPAGP